MTWPIVTLLAPAGVQRLAIFTRKHYSTFCHILDLDQYLDPLVNQGIINKDQSRINSKRNIYSPVNKNNHYHHYINRDEAGSVKIKVSDPSLFPTSKVLEQSFDKVFGYDEEDTIKNKKILVDKNGEITLDRLLKVYFSNPEDYFSKAYTEEDDRS